MARLSKFLAAVLFLLLIVLPTMPVDAAFPGLNGRILFTSDRGGGMALYTMRSDGSDVRMVVSTSSTSGRGAWSPDGTKILFTSDLGGNNDVYIANADGSNPVNLTNNPSSDQGPVMSPDGGMITFVSDRDGNNEIYVMNTDGSGVARLTNNADDDSTPRFSPDGTLIAFTSDRGAGVDQIYVMNLDGSSQTQLTNTVAGQNNLGLDWSPDSTRIVFRRFNSNNSREIFTIRGDGTDEQRLTNNTVHDNNPSYSADGSKVYFMSERDGNMEIYSMDPDGGNQLRLTNDAASDNNPVSQPLTISPTTLSPGTGIDASAGVASFDAPANHTDSYEGIDPTSVSITTQPQKGSVSVDPVTGFITYTKQAGTTGTDSFSYQICSSAHDDLCTTASIGVVLGNATLAETGTNQVVPSGIGMLIILLSAKIIRRSAGVRKYTWGR